MKLTIELIPSTQFNNNVRSLVSRQEWHRIRKNVYRTYGNKCAVCGAPGRLNAHEIWNFDEATSVQSLAGMICLCDLCHHVKHIGFAKILASQGKLNFDSVVEHFMSVNCCGVQEFLEHEREAFRLYGERSTRQWKLDISNLAKWTK